VKHPYRDFAIMTAISGVVMFLVMYLMIDTLADFRFNLNTLYMTAAMLAPMAIIMVAMMGHMYGDKRLNGLIYAVSALVFVTSVAFVRTQTTIGDRDFLTSMIPHHSGAILMCREASLTDPEIIALCREITVSQRREIEQMNRLLAQR
jgi:uncharacterized protein (DUF305 family)